MTMAQEMLIDEMTELTASDRRELAKLLVDVVADGASIGFLPPLAFETAEAYWSTVLADDVKVWTARMRGAIVGTIQLHLCAKQNGRHRAEIAKLMVHPSAQRQGIGRSLMMVAEERARQEHRSLLVLDTRAGDPSNRLYRSMGYVEAGRIPQYAQSADGSLDETVFYYKLL